MKFRHVLFRRIPLMLLVVLFAAVGLKLSGISKADTFAASTEAESGVLGSTARQINDGTASGGKAIVFDAAKQGAIYLSPVGNDSSGNGSAAAPFRTLSKAQSVANSGSTVYLRAGIYSGKTTFSKSGAAGAPITYAAYPGEKAILDGASVTYQGDGIVYMKGLHDITIQGLEIRNSVTDPNDTSYARSGAGIKIQDSRNINIVNNIVHDVGLNGIIVSGTSIKVINNEVYNTCLINKNGRMGAGGWPAAVSTERQTNGAVSSDIDFIGTYSHENWGEGIDAWFLDEGQIKDSRSINNYSVSIYVDDSRDIAVTNNYMAVTSAVRNRSDNNAPAHGLVVASETGFQAPVNIVVHNNTLGGGTSQGIVFHSPAGFRNITQSPNPQSF